MNLIVSPFVWMKETRQYTCLDDEDVLVPDRLPQLNCGLVVAELVQHHLGRVDIDFDLNSWQCKS